MSSDQDVIWRVVGGSGKGGIVVREGMELSSPLASDRLSTGACVQQLALDNCRLHYSKITGTGPECGWVSIKTAEKDLLTKVSLLSSEDSAAQFLKPVLSQPRDMELHVCTWNLLAPCYHRDSTGKNEIQTRFWRPRVSAQIASILETADPDVLCLQEVWMSPTAMQIIEDAACERGYGVKFCRRTGLKMDGVAVLLRKSRIELLATEEQEICMYGNRVCFWLLLQHLTAEGCNGRVVLGCTHFSFPHDEEDPQRLEQAQKTKLGFCKFAEKHGLDTQFAPLILAGDLNCPASAADDEVVDVFRYDGWRSTFMEANGKEAVNTHRTHRNNHSCADLILIKGKVKTVRAVLLPDDEPDTAVMPRPELGGAFGLSAPKSLHEWCQFSDHRPLVTKLTLGSTQPP